MNVIKLRAAILLAVGFRLWALGIPSRVTRRVARALSLEPKAHYGNERN